VQGYDVLIIRNERPKGGPGMRETFAVTLAMTHSRLNRVALVTDGRFSGTTDGPCVGHVSPEASADGPNAALCGGDEIIIDIPNRRLDARVDFAVRTPQPAPAREDPPG
jgi:dihydroxy-acid dehydratase